MKAVLKNGLIYPQEQIPNDWREGIELQVELAPSSAVKNSPSTAADGDWPPGFIENTFGSIQDESFIRHPQGDFDRRAEME